MTRAALFVGGLLASALIPVAGRALQPSQGPRCAADGVSLEKAPVVQIETDTADVLRFCCIGCAETWLEVTGTKPARTLVEDAASGQPIDARSAWFVRSLVLAQPATGDRIHAFRTQEDAERHAKAYAGRVLVGDAIPLSEAR
jgi:hypothetical protein